MPLQIDLESLRFKIKKIRDALSIDSSNNITTSANLVVSGNFNAGTYPSVHRFYGNSLFIDNSEYSGISLANYSGSNDAQSISFIDFRNSYFIPDTSIFGIHNTDGSAVLAFYATAAGVKNSDRRSGATILIGSSETTFNQNLKFGSSGKGIDFSINDNSAGMTSELLDDYEEGTWTPALTFGTANTGITYTSNNGKYTKIGNYVFGTGIIELSSKGSATGAAFINGLPFACDGRGFLLVHVALNANFTTISAIIAPLYSGFTKADLNYTIGVAGGSVQLTENNFTNTTKLEFSFAYNTST